MTIRVDISEGIAEVVLDRADKRNAINLEMFQGLVNAQQQLASDRSVRGVLLRGEGKAFCAGIDLATLMEGETAVDKLLSRPSGTEANLAQQVAVGWRGLSVPVAAAVHGTAFGAGLQIALGADVRMAAPDSQLSIMEVRWGIIPDMGITATARHLVGMDDLLDLAYSGRVIDAREARDVGLITRIEEDPLATARAWLQELVKRSPDALAAIKELFYSSWVSDSTVGWRREAALQRELLGGRNQREAVAAQQQGRQPRFTTE